MKRHLLRSLTVAALLLIPASLAAQITAGRLDGGRPGRTGARSSGGHRHPRIGRPAREPRRGHRHRRFVPVPGAAGGQLHHDVRAGRFRHRGPGGRDGRHRTDVHGEPDALRGRGRRDGDRHRRVPGSGRQVPAASAGPLTTPPSWRSRTPTDPHAMLALTPGHPDARLRRGGLPQGPSSPVSTPSDFATRTASSSTAWTPTSAPAASASTWTA